MEFSNYYYGKVAMRVLRIHRDGPKHSIREVSITIKIEGDFRESFINADNRKVVTTDTVNHLVHMVALEQINAENELFAQVLAQRFLKLYPQIDKLTIDMVETPWNRLDIEGESSHNHTFMHIGSYQPTIQVIACRKQLLISSGVKGLTVIKSTGAGFLDFYRDEYTILPDKTDRVFAVTIDANWQYKNSILDYSASRKVIIEAMLSNLAETYSYSHQDNLYRMEKAALEVTSDLTSIQLTINHLAYKAIDLSAFNIDTGMQLFTPLNDPYGQSCGTLSKS